jgi:hypothetical protein
MSKEAVALNSTRVSAPLRKINLWVLHKLRLLEDRAMVGESVLDIAELLVGLHAKKPQSPYLSLAARLPNSAPEQLDESLYRKRELLRAHAMRGTVHMLPQSQYETVLTATKGELDNMYRRAFSKLANKRQIQDRIYNLIEKRGSLSHSEIADLLPFAVKERDLHRLLNELCTKGLLVKSTVRGTWRSSIYNYEILNRWQPHIPAGESDVEKARVLLVKWYLWAYGPAATADVAWWTGFSQAEVKKAIYSFEEDVEHLMFDALNQPAWMLAEDLEAFQKWTPPRSQQVNMLPSFDPYVVAYIDRRRYIDDGNYRDVFTGVAGMIEPVIICDGRIVGTWKYNLKDGRVPVSIFKGSLVNSELLGRAVQGTSRFVHEADHMAAS